MLRAPSAVRPGGMPCPTFPHLVFQTCLPESTATCVTRTHPPSRWTGGLPQPARRRRDWRRSLSTLARAQGCRTTGHSPHHAEPLKRPLRLGRATSSAVRAGAGASRTWTPAARPWSRSRNCCSNWPLGVQRSRARWTTAGPPLLGRARIPHTVPDHAERKRRTPTPYGTTYPSESVFRKATRAASSSGFSLRLPSSAVFTFAATSGSGHGSPIQPSP